MQRDESKLRRWTRVVFVCARHPQILAAPPFRTRLRTVMGL